MISIKNVILGVSLIGSVLAYMLFESHSINICDIYCDPSLNYYHRSFIFFYFLLFFSLITYFTPDYIFRSWLKYTRVAAPLVLVISLIINLELHHSPAGDLQHIFDAPALWLLYSLFSLGSILALGLGWLKNLKAK